MFCEGGDGCRKSEDGSRLSLGRRPASMRLPCRHSSERWNPCSVRAGMVAAGARWVPAFAGTTAGVETSSMPSFQRTLESMFCEGGGGDRKSEDGSQRSLGRRPGSMRRPCRHSSERWNPCSVRAGTVAAGARWVPAFAGTTAGVDAPSMPSFQRTLESMFCEGRDGCRRSQMGPSFRWDDGNDCAFHAVIPANAAIHVPCEPGWSPQAQAGPVFAATTVRSSF